VLDMSMFRLVLKESSSRHFSWSTALLPRAVGHIVLISSLAVLAAAPLIGQTKEATTAWQDGRFHVDTKSVVGSSDIILQRPNLLPRELMPLGNGRLGAAVWAQDGYTAQLNRGDTFPHRLSPGQLVIPGLQRLTQASDYSARLDLYDGEFQEQGGGMSAVTYVAEKLDALVVEVKGADPKSLQTVELRLWSPRKPQVLQKGNIGVLAETWVDNEEAGASGETFGSLSAVTVDGTDLHVEQDGLAIKVSFHPRADGSFRVLAGAPHWRGGDALSTASELLAGVEKLSSSEHRTWWNQYWERVGLIQVSSHDQTAEYLNNLRTIDLYTAAAESRDKLPGAQAGIGDLFSSIRDEHQWGPSAYWHWNLRMQVSANLGAGVLDLNDSYFNLYRENLNAVLAWTKKHMGGRVGICVPETMRFNGQGFENETWISAAAINCGEDSKPYYNARTISTGAEVSLWIWQQFLFTDDLNFLRENYPVMREAARFYLAYGTHSADGSLHTFPSNAHETKWDVHDPTTDVSAMQALFPAVIEAAALLKIDDEVVEQVKKDVPKLSPLARISLASPDVLAAPDADGKDIVIAASSDPAAPSHNSENIGLEPVWPYGLIGDEGPLHALGVRTFLNRPQKNEADWSADPVQAARLGLAEDFKSSALALTERYQIYPSGLATLVGPEFYVEQIGVVADAIQTALVQDYDGLIRVSPAWPKDWNADGTVFVQHRDRVHVQIHDGELITVGIDAGSASPLKIRNPWPGESVEVINARTSAVVVPASSARVLQFSPKASTSYLIRPSSRKGSLRFEPVSGARAVAPKSLGSRTIGIPR